MLTMKRLMNKKIDNINLRYFFRHGLAILIFADNFYSLFFSIIGGKKDFTK